MKNSALSMIVGASLAISASHSALAEVTVNLSKMHFCCGACVKAVEGAIKKVEGASVKVDADAGTAKVTAADAKTTRQAVAAIARAGFHADSDHQKIKVADNSGVEAGKVKRLELVGVHNCCGGCNSAIQEALGSVEGVQSNTAKPKSETLVVEGDFDGLAVVRALNKAGFHVRAKGAEKPKKGAAEAQKIKSKS